MINVSNAKEIKCDHCRKKIFSGTLYKGSCVADDGMGGTAVTFIDDWICKECFDAYYSLLDTEQMEFVNGEWIKSTY